MRLQHAVPWASTDVQFTERLEAYMHHAATLFDNLTETCALSTISCTYMIWFELITLKHLCRKSLLYLLKLDRMNAVVWCVVPKHTCLG